MLTIIVVALALALTGEAKYLDLNDIERLVNEFGDEIITHRGLSARSLTQESNLHDVTPEEAEEVLEGQKEFDDEIPHPVGVNNWGSHLTLGQVSGVAVNPDDEPVVFHRGSVVWNER